MSDSKPLAEVLPKMRHDWRISQALGFSIPVVYTFNIALNLWFLYIWRDTGGLINLVFASFVVWTCIMAIRWIRETFNESRCEVFGCLWLSYEVALRTPLINNGEPVIEHTCVYHFSERWLVPLEKAIQERGGNISLEVIDASNEHTD